MQGLWLTIAQKIDPNYACIIVSGSLIIYPAEFKTQTVYLVTAKIMWKNVLNTPHAKYNMTNVQNFYINTPFDWFEYTCISLDLILEHFIQQYELREKKMCIYMWKYTKNVQVPTGWHISQVTL